MSDFLFRLAEQALGAPPAVQPLLVGRYAPGVPSADAEAEGFVEETVEREVPRIPATTTATPTAHAPAPRAAPSSPAPVDAHPRAAGVPTPAGVRPPAADRQASPRTSPAAVDRHPDAPRGERDADPPLVPTPTAASASASASAAASASASASALPSASMPAAAPVPDGEHRPPAPGDSSHPREPGMMRTEASSSARVERWSGDAGRPRRTAPDARLEGDADEAGDGDALLMPRIGTRRPAGAAEHGDDEDDATAPTPDGRARRTLLPAATESGAREMPATAPREEAARPVVQVTIGRIEVRAVHPPAAPQPARQAEWTPPVLSLDEYLKRGSGR